MSPLIHFFPKTVYQIKSTLKLDSNFVTKVKNLSGPQLKNFAHEKLENYFFLLNEQLTMLIYGLN